MNADILPKQCVIIGSFGIALSCGAIIRETMVLWVKMHAEYLKEYRSIYVKESATNLAIYVATALLSILLVRGVCKKNLVLMAPWLICAFAGVAYSMYFVIANLLDLPFGHVDMVLMALGIAAVETVFLYPLYSMFRGIWQEKSEAKRQQHLYSSPYNKNAKF